MQSNYRLQRVVNNQRHKIFSNDGNLELHLEAGSLPGSQTYVVAAPPGAIPGSLPAGMILVGDPYDVTASGASAKLNKPGALTLRYDAALTRQAATPAGLAIYSWRPEPAPGAWQPVAGTLDEQHRTMTATVEDLGVYALLAPGVGAGPPLKRIFLPITRN
jgi:hypothetical protein